MRKYNLKDRVLTGFDLDPDTNCWLWRRAITHDGYGMVSGDGVSMVAHRAAFICLVGPIPEGMTLDHLCRNRACVNPDHLEPVPFRENVLRGTSFSAVNARKTECSDGHPLTGDNLYIRPNGARQCRQCNANAAARYRARSAA